VKVLIDSNLMWLETVGNNVHFVSEYNFSVDLLGCDYFTASKIW